MKARQDPPSSLGHTPMDQPLQCPGTETWWLFVVSPADSSLCLESAPSVEGLQPSVCSSTFIELSLIKQNIKA